MTHQAPSRRSPAVTGSSSLATAFDLFLLDRKVQRASTHTLLFYERQMSPFLRWCAAQGITFLTDVTTAHIRAYLVLLQDRNLADRSVHAAARSLRAWLNFAVKEELLEASPMRKVSMPRIDQRILPAFEPCDVRRLLDACTTKRDRAAVLFLLDTGVRASEFTALDGRDVDTQRGSVRIVQGKGRKERVGFFGNEARRTLLRYYRERGGAPAAMTNTRPGPQPAISALQRSSRAYGKAATQRLAGGRILGRFIRRSTA